MLKVGKNRTQISPGIKIGQGVFFSQGNSVQPPAAPVATSATDTTTTGFTANWNASAGATGYYLDVSTQSDFSSFVSGYNNLNVGANILQAVTGLSVYTTYYYRVRAYNSGGTSGNSNTISQQTNYDPTADTQIFDWWNAQNNITTDAGDPAELVTWTGQQGNPANPPTITSRPLYGTDTINSLNAITYRVGGNFLRIDCTTLLSGVSIYMVIDLNSTANSAIIGDPNSGSRVILSASGSGSTADFANNFGGNINYYQNETLTGNNITRGNLYTSIQNLSILTLENVDLSSVTNLDFFAQNGGFASAAVGGDIIISSGSTFKTENITFLKDKYGL